MATVAAQTERRRAPESNAPPAQASRAIDPCAAKLTATKERVLGMTLVGEAGGVWVSREARWPGYRLAGDGGQRNSRQRKPVAKSGYRPCSTCIGRSWEEHVPSY